MDAMHPFAELTNRTPSPSQKDEGQQARKHSPWTAARHKKKTRSVQHQNQQQQQVLPEALPVFQQQHPIPESFDSPARLLRCGHGNPAAATAAAAAGAELGLGGGGPGGAGAAGRGASPLPPCSSSSSPSPHSSPPISRGSEQDAGVHPCKAYIVDPESASASPDNTRAARGHEGEGDGSGTAMMEADGGEDGSSGGGSGIDFAAVAARRAAGDQGCGSAPRSPVWFGSASLPQVDEEGQGAAGAADSSCALQHCSSAPASSNNLFERFGAVAQEQQREQEQHQQQPLRQQSLQQQQQQQAGPGGTTAARRRGLVAARRRSWGGSELAARAPAAAGGGGGSLSRLSAHSGGSDCALLHHSSSAGLVRGLAAGAPSSSGAAGSGLAPHCAWPQHAQQPGRGGSSDGGFQAHCTLGGGGGGGSSSASYHRQFCGRGHAGDAEGSDGSASFLRRMPGWQDDDDDDEDQHGHAAGCWGASAAGALCRLAGASHAGAPAAAAAGACRAALLAGRGGVAALAAQEERRGCDEGTLGWFEERLQEAAQEGDVAAGHQLWLSLQASGLAPSRRFMHAFLLCCHYGGSDPADAEQVVREMCAVAGDLEPDSRCAQLLAAIDISWQQLHCCGDVGL